jgi:hypothetical protein
MVSALLSYIVGRMFCAEIERFVRLLASGESNICAGTEYLCRTILIGRH